MSNFTQYKKLEMPLSAEKYNVSVFNKNSQVIDSELHKLELKDQEQDNSFAKKTELDDHINNQKNPHNVTKELLGLENVENKSSQQIRNELTKEDIINTLGYTPISIDHIPIADNDTNGLLSKEDHTDYDDANKKKHTHSNQDVLDGITSDLIDQWNAHTESGNVETIKYMNAMKEGTNGEFNSMNAVFIIDDTISTIDLDKIITSITLYIESVTFSYTSITGGIAKEDSISRMNKISFPFLSSHKESTTVWLYGPGNGGTTYYFIPINISSELATSLYIGWQRNSVNYLFLVDKESGTVTVGSLVNFILNISQSFYSYSFNSRV